MIAGAMLETPITLTGPGADPAGLLQIGELLRDVGGAAAVLDRPRGRRPPAVGQRPVPRPQNLEGVALNLVAPCLHHLGCEVVLEPLAQLGPECPGPLLRRLHGSDCGPAPPIRTSLAGQARLPPADAAARMSPVTRNRFDGEPFEDEDEVIARALEEMSIPALLCSLVHMTGDPSWVRSDIQPNVSASLDIQGGMSEEDMAEVRRRALPVIAAYRDNGCTPVPLSWDLLQEMMSFLGRRPVGGPLEGLLFDDLQFEGGDSGRLRGGTRSRQSLKNASPVVVIGCGMGGIVAGIRLKQAGLPFVILDKNGGPGGTWWENRYPGARVDVGSHQYCYSFEPAGLLERVLLPAP